MFTSKCIKVGFYGVLEYTNTMLKERKQNVDVALLRGINVGGNNKIPMKDLSCLFTKKWKTHVKTILATGNVLFIPSSSHTPQLAKEIIKGIEKEFGFSIVV